MPGISFVMTWCPTRDQCRCLLYIFRSSHISGRPADHHTEAVNSKRRAV